jgi:hypothetical protein
MTKIKGALQPWFYAMGNKPPKISLPILLKTGIKAGSSFYPGETFFIEPSCSLSCA